MIGIRIQFTAGRYHATGWDHHVNEGVPEWPPSPWRVLRALVAAGYRLQDPGITQRLPALVERLSAPPVYHLPKAAQAHLRHYMPTDGKPVKVLDSFVSVGGGAREPGEALMWWPEVELEPEQRGALERLVSEIAYLGRAESWVELSVLDAIEQQPNAVPTATATSAPPEQRVRLLAAQTPDQLGAWLRAYREQAGKPKRTKKGFQLPESVWDVLHVDTAQLRRYGWSRAPGSRWLDYQLDQLPEVRPRRKTRAAVFRPCGVVFELDARVLPKVEDTLIVAERMRSACMRASNDDVHWQLCGKDPDGGPRRGHDHAYFMPLENDRGRIARIVVWARGGFEQQAWLALQRIARSNWTLRGQHDNHPLHLIMSGYGDARQMLCVLGRERKLLEPAKRWVSATPFVPPRFSKRRGGELRDSPRDQLAQLCEQVLGETPAEILPWEPASGGRLGWNRFVRVRAKDRGRLGSRQAYGFELRFARAIAGPVCLGYGSHFGMGRFVGI